MKDLEFNDFELVEIDKIVVEDNARKKFDDTALNELTASIKKVGLINPITVSLSNGIYKVIAGERRFKASKMAGMTIIPCVVVAGEENRLKELQLIENCQRRDLNPIEELDAFMGLISSGYKPPAIAEQIGKSIKYVNIRLNLVRLTDSAKNMLYKESINLQHCKILVAMDEELQDKALQELNYTDGMGELKIMPPKSFHEFFLKNQTKLLSSAVFDTKDKDLIKAAIACVSCNHNNTVNTMLFAGISKDAICNNPACFLEKTQAHIQKDVIKYTKKGYKVIEVSENHSELYPSAYEFTKVPIEIIESEEFTGESIIIIVEGNKELGNSYVVYSEAQLKAISKASDIVDQPKDTKQAKQAEKAIKRYAELVVSRIGEKYIQQNELFTPGIHILAIWGLYESLELHNKRVFLSAYEIELPKDAFYSNFKNVFFDNVKKFEENIEASLAIISLLGLDSTMVYKDEPESYLINKLAGECGVSIEDCKSEISKEIKIDLSEV